MFILYQLFLSFFFYHLFRKGGAKISPVEKSFNLLLLAAKTVNSTALREGLCQTARFFARLVASLAG
jgi:hypothetical protein